MSFDKQQKRLAKYTMEELVVMDKAICEDPKNKNPQKDSIYLYTKEAYKKLHNIAWAITYKIDENKKNKV